MDLGDLIFFIIFIIIVVSNIVKQAKKSRKTPDIAPAKAKAGWKKVLEDIIKDARAQMEQRTESVPGQSGRPPLNWEDLMAPEPEERPLPQKESQPQAPAKIRPRTFPEAPGRESDFDDFRGLGPEADGREGENKRVKEKKSPRGMRRTLPEQPVAARTSGANLTVEDLKNAVIWNEILSPPLGLRN
jgi:hypothetical protein